MMILQGPLNRHGRLHLPGLGALHDQEEPGQLTAGEVHREPAVVEVDGKSAGD